MTLRDAMEMNEGTKEYYLVGNTTLDGKKQDKSVIDMNSGEVVMYDKFKANPKKYNHLLLTKKEANVFAKEDKSLSIEKL